MGAASWNEPHTFHTLSMQRRFMHPSRDTRDVPELREISRPHVESFNALWAEDPSIDAPAGIGAEGLGLLERSLQTLSPRVVFDGHGDGDDKGNRLECTSRRLRSAHRCRVAEPAAGAGPREECA